MIEPFSNEHNPQKADLFVPESMNSVISPSKQTTEPAGLIEYPLTKKFKKGEEALRGQNAERVNQNEKN